MLENPLDRKLLRCSFVCLVLPAALLHAAPPPSPEASNPTSQRALLDKYCVTCHSDKLKTGGLSLQSADLNKVPENAEVWEKVIQKLRVQAMPPLNMPRPDKATLDGFATSLENTIDKQAAARPNPGHSALHRLNRSEYGNAIRDLLALDVDTTALLPPDDESYGFDNIADVLGMTPRAWDHLTGIWHRLTLYQQVIWDICSSPHRCYARDVS